MAKSKGGWIIFCHLIYAIWTEMIVECVFHNHTFKPDLLVHAYISDFGRGQNNFLFPLNEQTMHLVDIANQIPLQSATDTIAGGLAKIASPA